MLAKFHVMYNIAKLCIYWLYREGITYIHALKIIRKSHTIFAKVSRYITNVQSQSFLLFIRDQLFIF